MSNQSLVRFRRLMETLPAAITNPIRTATAQQAQRLARAMVLAVPVRKGGDEPGGTLRNSIRTEFSSRSKIRVLVRAGGPTTTHNTAAGPYDYALAQEFGTEHVTAQPFFWPTYRALKKSLRQEIKRAMRAEIGKRVKLS